MTLRLPALAGSFYPASRNVLHQQVAGFIGPEPAELAGRLRAVIAPHAGYAYSGPVAGKAFGLCRRLAQDHSWRVILIGPSHQAVFKGLAVADPGAWRTPLGEVPVDPAVAGLPQAQHIRAQAIHAQEHCLEVLLPFLQVVLADFTVLPILTGEIDAAAAAELLEPLCDDCTLLVVSTDLSHYLPDMLAKQFDEVANRSIPALDAESFAHHGQACGKAGVLIALHLARKLGWRGHFIDYQTSGDVTGDRYQVVGYGAYAFTSGAAERPS